MHYSNAGYIRPGTYQMPPAMCQSMPCSPLDIKPYRDVFSSEFKNAITRRLINVAIKHCVWIGKTIPTMIEEFSLLERDSSRGLDFGRVIGEMIIEEYLVKTGPKWWNIWSHEATLVFPTPKLIYLVLDNQETPAI